MSVCFNCVLMPSQIYFHKVDICGYIHTCIYTRYIFSRGKIFFTEKCHILYMQTFWKKNLRKYTVLKECYIVEFQFEYIYRRTANTL